jgi:Ras family
MQTVGTELSVLNVSLPGSELDVRLHVLDTGGHPAQLKLVQESVGSSHNFCCLVYSVVDKDTFAAIKSWYGMLAARASRQCGRLQGVLIGNKMDAPAGTHEVRIKLSSTISPL